MTWMTNSAPTRVGGDDRCRRQAWDIHRVSAANTARSDHDSRGRRTWRRNTAASWRSARIPAFFDLELRASSLSQATSCQKIRYSSRNATADDHARQPLSSDAAGHRRGWPVRHPHVGLARPLTWWRDASSDVGRLGQLLVIDGLCLQSFPTHTHPRWSWPATVAEQNLIPIGSWASHSCGHTAQMRSVRSAMLSSARADMSSVVGMFFGPCL